LVFGLRSLLKAPGAELDQERSDNVRRTLSLSRIVSTYLNGIADL